jgi:3-oxoadipate enol-lactonase
MALLRVRGVDLYYEVLGSGSSCLVMAHGAFGSVAHTEAFGVQAADLAALGLRVISYDARGHGRSGYTSCAADYRPAALADDLLGLLAALGVERASVYGTSMGASTALMLAAAHPERVARLVLRSPSPFADDMVRARARLHPLASMYRFLGSSVTAGLVTMLAPAGERAKMKSLLRRQEPRAMVPAIHGFLSEPINPDILPAITAPSLILTQPDDPLHPLRAGELLRERMALAKLLVAPARRHWEENKQALTSLIASWLTDEVVIGAA